MENVREAQSDNICEKSVESLTITEMLTLLRAKYNLRVLRATLKTLALIKRAVVF